MMTPRRFIGVQFEPSAHNILEFIKWWLFPKTKTTLIALQEVKPGNWQYDEADYEEVMLEGKAPFKLISNLK